MSRLNQANVLAMSGRAIEAAGDVDVLLLDKTGTITLGNRQATEFLPLDGVAQRELADAAQLSSLADETPEGRSIVVLAKEQFNIRARSVGDGNMEFVPFTAQTKMSGVNTGSEMIDRICNQEAEYLPYLGKNDFSAWWDKDCVREYDCKEFDFTTDFYVSSIFLKETAVVNHLAKLSSRQDRKEIGERFLYFERLPMDIDESLFQYRFGNFVYSNARFNKEMKFDHNAQFYLLDSSLVIQLF